MIVDSGGAIAAMSTAEPRHKEFDEVPSRASAAVISPLVIAEVHYLLNAGGVPDAAAAFLEEVAGASTRSPLRWPRTMRRPHG